MREEIIKHLKNKNIKIPLNNDECINLFFGALVIESIGYWYDRSCDFIDNEKPSKPFERENSKIAKQDKIYRKNFSGLNNETKEQLKQIIKESIEGVLFSIFCRMDQTFDGGWKIKLETEYGEEIGTANKKTELHEDLYNWINIFNEN
jgi:hypothetical protein